ncbi:MAG: hypothetical protein ACTHZ6_13410 [Brevibacterium aurantiacum]|uniref:hypothetical protein n=1 Tax=Brevibacterium aurantiacum TaxID=273384 RepID=UPI003F925270
MPKKRKAVKRAHTKTRAIAVSLMATAVAVATPGFAQAVPAGLPSLPAPVNDALESLDPGQASS